MSAVKRGRVHFYELCPSRGKTNAKNETAAELGIGMIAGPDTGLPFRGLQKLGKTAPGIGRFLVPLILHVHSKGAH